MNYLNTYNILILRARRRRSTIMREAHHVCPKSLVNDLNADILNAKSNDDTVLLTYKEHLIAHLLLVKIFKDRSKNCYYRTLYAANMMRNRVNSSKEYAWMKQRYSKMMQATRKGVPSGAKGKKWSTEARQRRSELYRGKTYEEKYGVKKATQLKELRRQQRLGKKHSLETRKKLACPKSSEAKKNMSIAARNRAVSEVTRQATIARMRNDKTNPFVNQTIFEFKHTSGIHLKCRCIDMVKQFKLTTVYRLIKNTKSTSKGWSCLGPINKNEKTNRSQGW